MMRVVESGTAFIANLYHRTLADARLHVVETAGVAALTGGLSGMHVDAWGSLTFGAWRTSLIGAFLATAIWLAICIPLYRIACQAYRDYIANLLVDSGLLYMLLEHDNHEALPPLKRQESLPWLKIGTGGVLSFRGRIQAFLRCYAPCANSLDFHPYPRAWRTASRILDYLLVLLVCVLLYMVYTGILDAMAYKIGYPPLLKPVGGIVLLLVLCRATLSVARKNSVVFALTQVLIGEVERGRALLTRR